MPIGKGSLGRWIKERGKKDNQHRKQLPDQTRLGTDNKHQKTLSNPNMLDPKAGNERSPEENKNENISNTSNPALAQTSSNMQTNTGQFFKQNMERVEAMASGAEFQANKDWFKSWALCFVENAPKYMAENSYPKLISMCKGELILKGFKVLQCKNIFYFAFLVDNEVYVVFPNSNNGKYSFKVTIDDCGAISTERHCWNIKPCVLETLEQDTVDKFLSSSNSHILDFVVEQIYTIKYFLY